jgi:hypothetical protein
MKRILFLILWIIPALGAQAQGAIEIYVNGHKYDSLQAYQASKKAVVAPTPASLNSQQEDYIRKEAQQLGIDVDLSKVKTIQINQQGLSDSTRHKLYVLSVEHGVVGALQGFYQAQGQYDIPITHMISSVQLQGAIQQAVTASKDPKLLITEPGKMRIMALTTDETDK